MSEFTEKFTSWDEVIFPIEASFKTRLGTEDWLVVELTSKENTYVTGTVVKGNNSFRRGYTSNTWNDNVYSWAFKQQIYKYDPDQTGDTEEDI